VNATGPLLAAIAVVAGAFGGQLLGPSAGTLAILAAALSGLRARAGGRRGAAAALVALALLSAALMQRALDGLDGPLARAARWHQPVTGEVTLVDDPGGGRFSVRAVARTHGGGLVLLSTSGDVAMRVRLLSAGERAVVEGTLRPLHPHERHYRFRHVQAALDADDLHAVRPARGLMLPLANRLRAAVLAGTASLPGERRALAAGLLVGDTREISRPVTDDFRDSGLSHLLAVSGANVALVLALAAPVLRRFGLAGRFAGGLTVIVAFAAVTRFEPSVLRAGAMAAVALLATFLGRPAAGLRVLALAVTGLVLVDPFLVHSTGFRLSCAASAGIVGLGPRLSRRLPGPRWAREALATTAAAQLAVAPIVLPTFRQLPLVALPANVLAAPAAAAVTAYGTVSGLLSAVAGRVCPGWAEPLAGPLSWLVGYLRAVAGIAAGVRWPSGAGLRILLPLLCGVTVWSVRRRRPRGRADGPATAAPGRGTAAPVRPRR
jgi:competence protein ComEC